MILRALGKAAIKWLLIAAAFIALLSAINYGLSFVPFTPQWSGKQAVAKVADLTATVDALNRQAAGQAEIGQAVETYHTREVIVREATAEAINEARSAPDASTPLAPERAARLRGHDDRLCIDAPALCAPADPAGRSAGAVQPAGPAA